MKITFSLLCFLSLALSARAFSFFSSNTNRPPRLHVLMQPANDLIEEAQMFELNGDADKAVETYRKAIEELDRVAAENADRAGTAEFAPLRNKLAICNTQIDAIKLEQVSAAERRVAVTDTRELQKKYNAKHGIRDPESERSAAGTEKKTVTAEKLADPAVPAAEPKSRAGRMSAAEIAEAEARMKAAEEAAAKKAAAPVKTLGEHLEDAKDAIAAGEIDRAKKELVEVLRFDPDNWNARYLMAYTHVSLGDTGAAGVILADMLEDRPDDVPALLLQGAARMRERNFAAAQKSVERAIKANPRYYAGYHDMARLLVETGASRVAAKKYYETGLECGGPRDEELEKELGVKK